MALKIYGTATEITNIKNLEDMLENGIEAIVTFNQESFCLLRFNTETKKYECKFIPSDKSAYFSTYSDFSNTVFPMLTTFFL